MKRSLSRQPMSKTVSLKVSILVTAFLLWSGLTLALGAAWGARGASPRAFLEQNPWIREMPFLNRLASREGNQERYALFDEAVHLLRARYLHPLPEAQTLNRAAIHGVLQELDDPYTQLLEPEPARMNEQYMDGEFGGIGARGEWDAEREMVRLVEIFPDNPAAQAGLQPDDRIAQVDGAAVSELGLTQALQKVRGPVGTDVTLEILRGAEFLSFAITRAVIEFDVVEYRLLEEEPSVGYLKLFTFNRKSPERVRNALTDLLEQGAQALILDLRNNAGGLLDESVEIGGHLLGRRVIVTQRSRDGAEIQHTPQRGAVWPDDRPVVVLVNENSASASEVIAGALQDWDKATLVGQPTFGKGSVQAGHQLSDESLLRITTAQWYTPDGRMLDGHGLIPEIMVESDPEQVALGIDIQLETALEQALAFKG